MELIDTHCHLTHFAPERLEAIFENARKCSVVQMVSIGASDGLKSVEDTIGFAERFENVFASVGIHPHDAKNFTSLDAVESYLAHPKVVAIGETGLDFFRDWSPVEAQYELFRTTIGIARNLKKPLIIHCRDAREETFSVLKECGASAVGGVFHCYSEDATFAKRLEELNFIVSFTGNITFKKSTGLRDAIKEIPLERLMVETDCPYMAPEPFRGKESEPMHVFQVATKIAEIKGVSLEQVAATTTSTARKIFRLPVIATA